MRSAGQGTGASSPDLKGTTTTPLDLPDRAPEEKKNPFSYEELLSAGPSALATALQAQHGSWMRQLRLRQLPFVDL